MAKLLSLCNEIEQFLQENDQHSINQFLSWIQQRLNISSDNREKSLINTSQRFSCQCGHRYSLRFEILSDELNENSEKRNNREARLHHYPIHPQGLTFCQRCYQFYNHEQIKSHDCEEKKIDELQSLEQLIPPDTTEQEQTKTTSVTRFGLPKLTDSMVEISHPDGKRQFRCPLCLNSYVNRSGLNRHYITHSSQELWKVECQFCGKRYSRKDSLKHHIKTQHTQFVIPNWIWKEKNHLVDEKEHMDHDEVVLVT